MADGASAGGTAGFQLSADENSDQGLGLGGSG